MTIKINGEEIPEQAIEYELGRLIKFYSGHMSAEQIRKQMDALKEKACDQAVGAKLLINEANKLDITVPASDLDEKINEMVKNSGSEEMFDQLLQSQNMTRQMVRDSLTRGRQVDMLIEKIIEGASDPTEEEIKAHFEAHKKEYKKPDRVQAQHILIRTESGNEENKATAKSKLLEIKSKIEEGADFADMAASHSDCPSGKKAGGSLGWFSRGMMVPEFDKAVFSLETNTLSDIVESSFGYHLIYKTAAEKGEPASFEEAREKVREFLRHVRRGEVISGYVSELKEKAVIEEV
ncbi:peptidylprolyl isomerase [Verrucomicrobiota bacterium]